MGRGFSFRRKLRVWLRELMSESDSESDVVDITSYCDEGLLEGLQSHEHCIRFEVINAAGGRIVQVVHYDRVKDIDIRSLHIITLDEDLPTALAHILTLTTLGK